MEETSQYLQICCGMTLSSNILAPFVAYPSPEERENRLDHLSIKAHGRLVEYGRSVKGRPLRAVCVPSPNSNPKRILVCANIHGPEFIGGLVALAFLEQLGQQDSPAQKLLEKAEIWVIPCLNPDGYALTWEKNGRGRLAEFRCNHNGVDLNRNFPIPSGQKRSFLPFTGSKKQGKITYIGMGALSEPETRDLCQLLTEQRFHASLNLHSFMGTTIPPRVTTSSEYRTYRMLCRKFKRAQAKVRYLRLASRFFDGFTGEMEDFQHHTLGCWSVCVEVMTLRKSYAQHLRAPTVFWRFNPRNPDFWIQNDLPGIVAYFNSALEMDPPTDLMRIH